MLDHDAAMLALRARLRALSVCTTGATDLVATTTGYTRAAGSFLTDGFRVGMEFLPAAFATNAYHVVKSVTASTITTFDTITAEATASGRSLTVGLPETRIWENEKPVRSGVIIEAPTTNRPYVTEEYIPATHRLKTFPAASGRAMETGLYVVNWYGVSGLGPAGIRDCVTAVLARFTPGTNITAGSDTLRISSETAPWADQIRPLASGWSVATIRIPFWAETTNLVAA